MLSQNVIGKKFGDYTVISLHKRLRAGNQYTCECSSCGSNSVLPYSKLKRKLPGTGCRFCTHKYRVYPLVETLCSWCGAVHLVSNNRIGKHPTYCSNRCSVESRRQKNSKDRRQDFTSYLKLLAIQIKSRAKRKNLDFDLDANYLLNLLDKQDGKCYITDVHLTPSVGGTGKGLRGAGANVLTVDRVDSDLGYTKDNVKLCSYIANTAKNRFSLEELVEFCNQVVNKSNCDLKEGRRL